MTDTKRPDIKVHPYGANYVELLLVGKYGDIIGKVLTKSEARSLAQALLLVTGDDSALTSEQR